MTQYFLIKKIFIFTGPTLAVLLLSVIAADLQVIQSEIAHSAIRTMSTAGAFVVSVLAIIGYFYRKSWIFLLTGVGFACDVFFGISFSIETSFITDDLFAGPLQEHMTWNWFLKNLFLSFYLALAGHFWLSVTNHVRLELDQAVRIIGFTIFAVAAIQIACSFFPMPNLAIGPEFIPRPLELISAILFLLALFGFKKRAYKAPARVEFWFVTALALKLISQSVFSPYTTEFYEQSGTVSALISMFGTLCFMCGLIEANYQLFKREGNILSELTRLQASIDQHAIVSITDLKGSIIYCNDAFCETSGYRRDELLGKTHTLLRSDEHDDIFYKEMWQQIASGNIWNGVFKNIRKNGDPYWVQATIVPYLDVDGKPFQYAAIRTDITTSRILTDTAIKESELLSATKENLSQGLSVFDGNLKMIVSNKRFGEILDLPDDLIAVGTDYADIIRYNAEKGEYGPGDIEELVSERVLLARNPVAHRFDRKLKNGKTVQIVGSPMPGGGFVSTYSDITERKKLENDLIEAKNKAETANEAKSNFLATMSHEIRTPLNGVLGMAQLLRDEELGIDQRTKVDNILSSGETLLEILNDVLDMSKIESGNVQLEKKTFNLQTLVSSLCAPYESLSQKRGLAFKVKNVTAEEALYVGDSTRIRQIIQNLLSNAFKFTNEGSICVNVDLDKRPKVDDLERRKISIDVVDTGTGIAKERVAHIFDVFVQEDNTITRKFGGSGLGLSIVKNLANLMDGEIDVQSEEGKGSTFSFAVTLPLPDDDEKNKFAETIDLVAPPKIKQMKILVAEDNDLNALIVQTMLEKQGHEVAFALNGLEAVEYLKENKPDIILMDVHMPQMSGIEATSVIRKDYTQDELPIVGVTAESFNERIQELKEAGMNEVLTKPFTKQQLYAVLARFGSKSNDLEND